MLLGLIVTLVVIFEMRKVYDVYFICFLSKSSLSDEIVDLSVPALIYITNVIKVIDQAICYMIKYPFLFFVSSSYR